MAASPILMPKLGLTMTEGLLAEWRVQPGDSVRAGEVIFAVETDKITSEVEARADGRIEEIRVAVGETVPVGAVVATWTGPAFGVDEAEDPQAPVPPAEAAGPVTPTEPATSAQFSSPPPTPPASGRGEARIIATPLARRLAREAGIGLEGIAGSGPHGRIKAEDIAAHLARPAPVQSVPVTPAPAAAIPFTALIDADLTALLDLHARLVAEANAAITLGELVRRALERVSAGRSIELLDLSASGVTWLVPSLAEGQVAVVAMGAARDAFLPGAHGAPVLRQIISLTLAGNPQQLSAEDGATLLGQLARLLQKPLKILA